MFSLKKACCAAFLALALALPAHAADFSAKDLKSMSVFLSNFTELGFMDVDAAAFLDEKAPGDMIRFGIWHNYVNNFKSRIKRCRDKGCPWGSLTIDGKFVQESLKRYFDCELKNLPTVEDSDPPYHFDGRLYHFEGADGEATYYAAVRKAERTGDGLVRMSGTVYNAEDEKDVLGTFTAVARPHEWNGKKTWALLELKTTVKE